jgi:hypothetical protein
MLIGSASPIALEVSGRGAEESMDAPSAEDPMGAFGVEIPMGVALSLDYPVPSMPDPGHNAASIDVLPSLSVSALPAYGFPLFLFKLHVPSPRASLFLQMGVPFANFCTCSVS